MYEEKEQSVSGQGAEENRCYITGVYHLRGTLPAGGEKMEPGRRERARIEEMLESRAADTRKLGNVRMILVKYVEEAVTYMADYEYDDQCRILTVRYDPVPVSRQEKTCILRKDSEGCGRNTGSSVQKKNGK